MDFDFNYSSVASIVNAAEKNNSPISALILAQQAQHQVLDADELVLHGLGLPGGGAQDLVGGLGDIDLVRVAALTGHPGQAGQFFGHGGGKAAGLHVHFLEQLGDQPVFLAGDGQQQVLGLQGVVLVLHGQLLGGLDGLDGLLGILVGIHMLSLQSYTADAGCVITECAGLLTCAHGRDGALRGMVSWFHTLPPARF